MNKRGFSRRKFLQLNGLTGTGFLFGLPFVKYENQPQAQTNRTEPEPVIDIHQHTHYAGRADEALLQHQLSMGITQTILLPSGRDVNSATTHFGFSNGLEAKAYGNESCYQLAKDNPGRFFFGTCEVPDIADATVEIERYLKLGAKVIGELKFGIDCDAPSMHAIYELAKAYQVPVLMHWQFKRYNYGYERFYKILEKYPDVNFFGHAQTWWANVNKAHKDQSDLYPKTKFTPGGITDRLLADYPNMYADLSANSGLNFFTRDEEQAAAFVQRHQNKLVYGSDCDDSIGKPEGCQGARTILMIKKLAGSRAVERKLLYENAKRVFKI